MHRNDDQSDFFAASDEEFGNFVGINEFELPYMSLPFDILDNFINTARESFWYFEATADWYAYQRYPQNEDSFEGAYTLTAILEAPLWSFWTNYPVDYMRDTRSYALSNLLYYFTEIANLDALWVTDGFYKKTPKTPQQYLYDGMGGEQMRKLFLVTTSRMVNNHDFITKKQLSNSAELVLSKEGLPEDSNEFVLELRDKGTTDWFRRELNKVTTAWSFNTVKLSATYDLQFNGDK